jgi:hypothetical protein
MINENNAFDQDIRTREERILEEMSIQQENVIIDQDEKYAYEENCERKEASDNHEH